MAIFACVRCGWTMEHMVSNVYRKSITARMDQCARCEKPRRFYFMAPSGCVGRQGVRPEGVPPPSKATLWWRKMREGKTASAPLDAVCSKWEF
jgi:hypothetical protein